MKFTRIEDGATFETKKSATAEAYYSATDGDNNKLWQVSKETKAKIKEIMSDKLAVHQLQTQLGGTAVTEEKLIGYLAEREIQEEATTRQKELAKKRAEAAEEEAAEERKQLKEEMRLEILAEQEIEKKKTESNVGTTGGVKKKAEKAKAAEEAKEDKK